MPGPRSIGDRAMTPAERQRRRRLRLSGGPAGRLRRELQRAFERALEAGLSPKELAAVVREEVKRREGGGHAG